MNSRLFIKKEWAYFINTLMTYGGKMTELDEHYTRYMCAKWYVKLYRILKYYPRYFLFAMYIIVIKWFILYLGKIPVEESEYYSSRFDYAKHLYRIVMSSCEIKMGNYYTIDEILDGRTQED